MMASSTKPRITIATGHFPPKIYGTEDKVSGHIYLQHARPELIGAIAIKLWGSSIYEEPAVEYRSPTYDSRPLFTTLSIVNSCSTPLEDGKDYIWPFSIIFPPSIADQAHLGQPLPPSIENHAKSSSFRIIYNLTAIIYKHGTTDHMYKVDQKIQFAPTLPANHPIPSAAMQSKKQTFVARSTKLFPEAEGHAHNFPAKSKLFFRPSNVPRATFDVSLSWPNVVVVGRKFNVCVGVNFLSAQSTLSNVPKIRLQALDLMLVVSGYCTHFSSMGSRDSYGPTSSWEREWRDVGDFTEEEGWMKVLSATVPHTTIPDFQSSMLQRKHMLNISATVCIGDKTFKFNAEAGRYPFRLLPRIGQASQAASDPLQSVDEARMVGGLPPSIDESGYLPSYQEALAAPGPVGSHAPRD